MNNFLWIWENILFSWPSHFHCIQLLFFWCLIFLMSETTGKTLKDEKSFMKCLKRSEMKGKEKYYIWIENIGWSFILTFKNIINTGVFQNDDCLTSSIRLCIPCNLLILPSHNYFCFLLNSRVLVEQVCWWDDSKIFPDKYFLSMLDILLCCDY